MKTIQIAPYLHEINIDRNIVQTEFNGMRISWALAIDPVILDDSKKELLKQAMQAAIAMSSKSWQIKVMLTNSVNVPSLVNITKIK